jgi:hypothetical protein
MQIKLRVLYSYIVCVRGKPSATKEEDLSFASQIHLVLHLGHGVVQDDDAASEILYR